MLDWTDRHCRYFHRLISRHTWLYTEMVTTGALLYGDVAGIWTSAGKNILSHCNWAEANRPIWRSAPDWGRNGDTTRST